MEYIILTVALLGAIALSQGIQIIKLSKQLFAEYTHTETNKKN